MLQQTICGLGFPTISTVPSPSFANTTPSAPHNPATGIPHTPIDFLPTIPPSTKRYLPYLKSGELASASSRFVGCLRLLAAHGYTPRAIATALGYGRPHVTNNLRLHRIPHNPDLRKHDRVPSPLHILLHNPGYGVPSLEEVRAIRRGRASVNADRDARICALYPAQTCEQIAAKYRITKQRVQQIIARRDPSRLHRSRLKERESFLRVNPHFTLDRMAELTGTNERGLYHFCVSRGIPFKHRPKGPDMATRVANWKPNARDQKIMDAWLSGKLLKEIAHRHHTSTGAIAQRILHLRAHGIDLPMRRRDPRATHYHPGVWKSKRSSLIAENVNPCPSRLTSPSSTQPVLRLSA